MRGGNELGEISVKINAGEPVKLCHRVAERLKVGVFKLKHYVAVGLFTFVCKLCGKLARGFVLDLYLVFGEFFVQHLLCVFNAEVLARCIYGYCFFLRTAGGKRRKERNRHCYCY